MPIVIAKLPSSFAATTQRPTVEVFDYDFSERHWGKAKRLRDEQIQSAAPAHSRLHEVQSELINLFTAGSVQTGLRAKQKPEVTPLAANVWSVVKLHNVFSWYQIDPREPGTHSCCGDAFHWIYVFRADIDRYIAGLKIDSEGSGGGGERQASDDKPKTSQSQLPGRNRRRAIEYFEAKSVGETWCGLDDDIKALKDIAECANLRRAEMIELRRDIASKRGAALPTRGRPRKSPSE